MCGVSSNTKHSLLKIVIVLISANVFRHVLYQNGFWDSIKCCYFILNATVPLFSQSCKIFFRMITDTLGPLCADRPTGCTGLGNTQLTTMNHVSSGRRCAEC